MSASQLRRALTIRGRSVHPRKVGPHGVTEPSRLTRTPSPAIVVTQFAIGAVLLVFAFLSAGYASGDRETMLAVGLGAAGGLLVGQGLGMARHRRAAQRAE